MRSADQLRLTPIDSKCQVPEDRYLAGVLLHPQEGF
jgi:hypothetical protein